MVELGGAEMLDKTMFEHDFTADEIEAYAVTVQVVPPLPPTVLVVVAFVVDVDFYTVFGQQKSMRSSKNNVSGGQAASELELVLEFMFEARVGAKSLLLKLELTAVVGEEVVVFKVVAVEAPGTKQLQADEAFAVFVLQ